MLLKLCAVFCGGGRERIFFLIFWKMTFYETVSKTFVVAFRVAWDVATNEELLRLLEEELWSDIKLAGRVGIVAASNSRWKERDNHKVGRRRRRKVLNFKLVLMHYISFWVHRERRSDEGRKFFAFWKSLYLCLRSCRPYLLPDAFFKINFPNLSPADLFKVESTLHHHQKLFFPLPFVTVVIQLCLNRPGIEHVTT